MAFPWIFHANNESGTLTGEWTSETDGNGVLSIQHYSDLARHGARLEIPYRGARAMYINLTGADTTQYVQEDTAFDITVQAVYYLRFYFYAKGLTMAASDRFTIFTIMSAGPTDEAVVDVYNNAGIIQLVAAETGATAIGATTRATDLIQGQWHCIELTLDVDADAGGNGVITLFVDGHQVGATIATVTQAPIIHARLGAMGIDAGTTAGHLLFDELVFDDGRVYPHRSRFPQSIVLTKSGHAAVGRGRILRVDALPLPDTDTVVTIYDTDEANILAAQDILSEVGGPASIAEPYGRQLAFEQGQFERGCYVALSGTNPRAQITFAERLDENGIRDYAHQRKAHATV